MNLFFYHYIPIFTVQNETLKTGGHLGCFVKKYGRAGADY